jgi:outer membrane immunogenic protein
LDRLHFGAFAGYKYSAVDHDMTLGGAFNQLPPVKSAIEPRGAGNLDNDGAELGGLVGYNYQYRQLVFGLEAAGGYLWARESDNTGEFLLGQGVPPVAIRTSFKTHYLVTVGPRLGYAWRHLLPYVTGGLAVGDLDFSQSIHNLADPSIRLGGEKTQTNAGWMVGGGLQYAFSQHWSARAQYQYIDLGHASLDASVFNFFLFRSHHEVSLTEHNASFALIYQF